MKKLLIVILTFFLSNNLTAAIYYSQSSGAFNNSTRWNTARNGSGSSHDATYSNTHTYYIQNGHSITSSTSPNIGNSSSTMIIENGGTYTHTSATTSTLTLGTLRIEGGGLYIANRTGQTITTVNIYANGKLIHNTGNNTIIGTNRNYSNATNGGNGNGTYEIQNHGASAISVQPSWGNLIVNRSGGVVAFSTTQTIAGNLEITAGTLNLGTSVSHTTNSLSFAGTAKNGGSWGSTASAATNKTNTYFTTGITGIINNSSALPVELIFFKCFFDGQNNILQWETASENNSSYFKLENSIDGNIWDMIHIVDAAGNSTNTIKYSFTHTNFKPALNYYILKQYDIDGTFTTYGPVSIDNRTTQLHVVKLFNLLGQQVNPEAFLSSGIYIEVYSNGESKKVFK